MERAGKGKAGSEIIPTPAWVLVARIFQIVLSLVVLGLCGTFVHWLYADQLGFAIICCIMTWIVSLYNILSEKVPACRRGYNHYAAMSLDVLMIIFWLAAMGAVAAYRGTFTTAVNASCSSDGSAINSGTCVLNKRGRVEVATKGALNLISGAAGVSAVIMLLFVASFAYVCHYWRISGAHRSSGDPEKIDLGPTSGGIPPQQVSAQQVQPLLNQPSAYPELQGHSPSQQAAGQYYAAQDIGAQQPQYSQHGAAPYDPYMPQTVNTQYHGASEYSGYHGAGAQQQPMYSAHSTPAPGQMYQPPAHS